MQDKLMIEIRALQNSHCHKFATKAWMAFMLPFPGQQLSLYAEQPSTFEEWRRDGDAIYAKYMQMELEFCSTDEGNQFTSKPNPGLS